MQFSINAIHNLHLKAELSDDLLDLSLLRHSQPLSQLSLAPLDIVLHTSVVNESTG